MAADRKTRANLEEPAWLQFPGVRPIAQFMLTMLLMWLLYGVFGSRGHIIYIWPVTGVQVALLLTGPEDRRERWLQIAAAATGMFVAGIALGNPLWLALLQSGMQAGEVWALRWILSKRIGSFDDLRRQANVVRFCASAVMVPLFAALLIEVPSAVAAHRPIFQAWTRAVLSDSLGIAVFAPAMLLLLSLRLSRSEPLALYLRPRISAFTLFMAALVVIFTQNLNPFLFLIFPPLILAVFVMGLEGAVCASVAGSGIACWATAHGEGPLWLMQGVTLDHRIFILQIFLWAIVATALPIGSLLDERRESQRQACKNERIYQTLMQNSQNMIILSALDGGSRFVSPAVNKITGWTQEEFLQLSQLEIIHPEDRDLVKNNLNRLADAETDHTFRHRLLHKNGGWGWVEACVAGYRDSDSGPIVGYVATIHDVASEKEIEDFLSVELAALSDKNAQLNGLATRDELTGIANRRTFNQALPIEAESHAHSGEALSLLMIDVDSFKKFNDRYGHQAGDVCLQTLARTFEERSRKESGLAARLGGEEFAILLPSTDEWGATWLAEDILKAVQDLQIPHQDSTTGFASVSIGISSWVPYETTDPALLVQHADQALYESKAAGRNRATMWNSAAPTLDLPPNRKVREEQESAEDASKFVQNIWNGSR